MGRPSYYAGPVSRFPERFRPLPITLRDRLAVHRWHTRTSVVSTVFTQAAPLSHCRFDALDGYLHYHENLHEAEELRLMRSMRNLKNQRVHAYDVDKAPHLEKKARKFNQRIDGVVLMTPPLSWWVHVHREQCGFCQQIR